MEALAGDFERKQFDCSPRRLVQGAAADTRSRSVDTVKEAVVELVGRWATVAAIHFADTRDTVAAADVETVRDIRSEPSVVCSGVAAVVDVADIAPQRNWSTVAAAVTALDS